MPGDRRPSSNAESPQAISSVSHHAARSFATVAEAIDATLSLMRDLLDMDVQMVNHVEADRHIITGLQVPPGMPPLEGLTTPLNHNF